MSTNVAHDEMFDLIQRIRKLPPACQLYLVARVAENVQTSLFPPTPVDQEAEAKAAREWAEEYIASGAAQEPYPIPEEWLAQIPKLEVRCENATCNVVKSSS